MKESVIGRVRNTDLPRSRPLLPIFEAVTNSFQSLDQLAERQAPYIHIEASREGSLDERELGRFDGFTIQDNGVGFNDDNFDAFQTADTQYKAAIGGKGLGRFSWLKAFQRVHIDSHYEDGGQLLIRRFAFLLQAPKVSAPKRVWMLWPSGVATVAT